VRALFTLWHFKAAGTHELSGKSGRWEAMRRCKVSGGASCISLSYLENMKKESYKRKNGLLLHNPTEK